MNKIVIGLIFFFSSYAYAFEASMSGSNLEGLTRESTIAEYRANIRDTSENLLDISGSNLLNYSEDFSQNSPVRCSAADGALDPNLGLSGDFINEGTDAANTHYARSANTTLTNGITYTFSTYARPSGRNWVALSSSGETAVPTAYFNLATRNVGTTANCTAWFCGKKNGWDRICMTFTADTTGNHQLLQYIAEADNDITFTGNGTVAFELFGRQLTENRTYLTGPGVYHPTVALDKPYLDLTSQNEPFVYSQSDLQKNNGRRYEEVQLNGTNQYWSRGADGIWDVNDQDHTYTMYYLNAANNDYLFQHSYDNFGGIAFRTETVGVTARYQRVGSTLEIISTAPAVYSRYKILQEVRSGNLAKVCVDGQCSAWTDVVGYGTDDATRGVTLGASLIASAHLAGSVVYFRLDAEALSDEKLNNERMRIWGVGSGQYLLFPEATFTRSTEAHTTLTNTYENDISAPSIIRTPINVPRVGGEGGGILIEGEQVNVGKYTEAFGSWTVSNCVLGVTCALSSNAYYSPSGELIADGFANNVGAGANTGNIYMDITPTGGISAGDKWTLCIYHKSPIVHTSQISFSEQGVATTTIYLQSTLEWNPTCTTRTMVGGGTGTFRIRIYGGISATTTGEVHLYGFDLKKIPFETSYIENTGTGEVTRTADSLTFDPHPEDSRDLIPTTFSHETIASELTVYLEAKCEWSGVTDIGISRTIIEIGGNTGVSSGVRNRIYATVDGATADIYFAVWDDTGTPHFARLPGGSLDHSEWFSIRGIIDFEDLSNLDLYVSQTDTTEESNAGVVYFGNTGTAELNTEDSLIRIGQQYDGTVDSFCRFKNLRIEPRIILP